MVACGAGNSAIVSRLVQVPGLDINYQTEAGVTAVHRACRESQTECVRILAETDRVDWNKADEWGRTPLSWALMKGLSDVVEIILQQPNIDYNVKTVFDLTLAQIAVCAGDVKCVETLAAQETFDCWNVPGYKYNGAIPIMMALNQDKTEIARILLGCPRVDLSCSDKEGWSLVFRAIQKNELGEKM